MRRVGVVLVAKVDELIVQRAVPVLGPVTPAESSFIRLEKRSRVGDDHSRFEHRLKIRAGPLFSSASTSASAA
jgi:hypothetical protein